MDTLKNKFINTLKGAGKGYLTGGIPGAIAGGVKANISKPTLSTPTNQIQTSNPSATSTPVKNNISTNFNNTANNPKDTFINNNVAQDLYD